MPRPIVGVAVSWTGQTDRKEYEGVEYRPDMSLSPARLAAERRLRKTAARLNFGSPVRPPSTPPKTPDTKTPSKAEDLAATERTEEDPIVKARKEDALKRAQEKELKKKKAERDSMWAKRRAIEQKEAEEKRILEAKISKLVNEYGIPRDVLTTDPTMQRWCFALMEGDAVVVDELIRAKKDLADTIIGTEATPLVLAFAHGHEALAKLLIANGANVDKAGAKDASTPLHIAVETGNVEMARLLISKGANVNAARSDGKTPILLACFTVDKDQDGLLEPAEMAAMLELSKLLLESGVSVDAADQDGVTALTVAFNRDFEELKALLLSYGASMEPIEKAEAERQARAAIKMQAMQRGRNDRVAAQKKLEEKRKLEWQAQKQAEAAAKVQAIQRGRNARAATAVKREDEAKKAKEAATKAAEDAAREAEEAAKANETANRSKGSLDQRLRRASQEMDMDAAAYAVAEAAAKAGSKDPTADPGPAPAPASAPAPAPAAIQ